MLSVGLTGGVASGKSEVAALLSAHGAAVRDADAVVADLYEPGREGARAVATLFGSRVLDGEGRVDRVVLRELVLADAGGRSALEAIVHPLVRAEVGRWLATLEGRGGGPAVAVIEAALLVETGAFRAYHRLVVVSSPLETRRQRALAAGWSADRFQRTAAAQASETEREAVADYVVRNQGSRAALAGEVDTLWSLLLADEAALRRGEPLPARR